jgi:hypothetical protein
MPTITPKTQNPPNFPKPKMQTKMKIINKTIYNVGLKSCRLFYGFQILFQMKELKHLKPKTKT